MKDIFKCESVRLCRYLYGLGFDKESKFDSNGKEYWIFKYSSDLQESLDFYFYMRKKFRSGCINGESNFNSGTN